MNPELDRLSNAEWDLRAEVNWLRLSEERREYWRERVRERLPELSRREHFCEGLAKGWALDPEMMAGMPPPRNALTDKITRPPKERSR